MERIKICDMLVKYHLKVELPISIIDGPICSIGLSFIFEKNNIIVQKAIPFAIRLGTECGREYSFDYLTKEQQKVWSRYNYWLFNILHEIGHAKTYKGINEVEDQKGRHSIQCFSVSQEEANVNYRKLPSEARADAWATQWVIDHPAIAKSFSDMLESAIC